jgi:hypothetical protein
MWEERKMFRGLLRVFGEQGASQLEEGGLLLELDLEG